MQQVSITIERKSRGYHLITRLIQEQLDQLTLPDIGLLHIFIQHTSAAITINENYDADVRADFESIMNYMVPENLPFIKHTLEGPDDMVAHIKSSLLGNALTIPIRDGRLALGQWQGIYLCEFRNHASPRQLILTIN